MKRLLLILLIVFLLNLTSPVLSQDAELGFKLGANVVGLIDGDGFSGRDHHQRVDFAGDHSGDRHGDRPGHA